MHRRAFFGKILGALCAMPLISRVRWAPEPSGELVRVSTGPQQWTVTTFSGDRAMIEQAFASEFRTWQGWLDAKPSLVFLSDVPSPYVDTPWIDYATYR